MPLDLSAAKAALADAFQGTTLTVRRDNGAPITEACGCRSTSLTLAEGDAVVTRTGYVISTHGDSALRLLPDERVTVASLPGQVLRIVGPLASNLGLTRSYTAVEAR